MDKIEISQMEYQALLSVGQMVRVCLQQPDAGEFLVAAIQALDKVRQDEQSEALKLKTIAKAVNEALYNE